MLPAWLEPLLFFYTIALGACIGSFLNVVIARLPEGLSVVKPRSRCPKCGKEIAWYDNIPLVSYAMLRGRCRGCGVTIPLRYPLVEALTAGVFGAFYVRFGPSWDLAVWLPLSAALLAITFLDIDHWWVPDVITYPTMLYTFLAQLLPGQLGPVLALLGLAPALLLLAVAYVFEKVTGKEGLGFGDVKLLALLGLALGLSDALTTLLLAALQGAAVGTLVVLSGGHKQAEAAPTPAALADDDWQPDPHAVPFGPFLALACLEVVLLPDLFTGWHHRLSDALLRVLQ